MTDASDYGIGALVYQLGDNGEPCPVYFYSKKISKKAVERTIVEKETLAVLAILEHLRSILYGHKINIYCDNLNLTYLQVRV